MIAQFQFLPVDSLSLVFGGLALLLIPLVFIYSIKYIRTNPLHYFIPFFILSFGIIGVFFVHDFLSFYVFLEVVTLSSYFLIIQPWRKDTLEAGFKYLIMNLIGGVLILFSILVLFNFTGSFDYSAISQIAGSLSIDMGILISSTFLIGALIKCGAVPFHTRLPDAHPAAPSPISAILSGIVIKIGVYGIIRYMLTLQLFPEILVFVGVFSMLFGIILALRQDSIKRLLAYSSISQIGYILLGIGLGTGLGMGGGIFHAVSHTLFKMLLFLCVGAIIYCTGERKIQHLGGLAIRMPVTFALFTIGAFSISGIPPFNGFVSKEILYQACYGMPYLETILILTAAGTFALSFKMFRHVFLGDLPAGMWKAKDPSLLMLVPMFVLASACLGFGLFWQKAFFQYVYPVMAESGLVGRNGIISVQNPFSIIALSHTLKVVILGFIIYFIGIRMGWLGVKRERSSVIGNIFSLDRLYIYVAKLFYKLGVMLRELQFRSLNTNLLWVFVVLLIFYFVLLLRII